MARIRTVKPEFWTNEQVCQCSAMARLLFIGLLNFCDDGGVHQASTRRLKAEVLPADDCTIAEVGLMMDELLAAGLVGCYECDGKSYWYVTGWHHQKIDKATYSYPGSKELGEKAAQYRRNLLEKQEKTRRDFDEGSTTPRRGLDDSSPPERKGKERKGKECNGDESKGVDVNTSCAASGEQTPAPPAEDFSLGIEHHVWPYFVVTGAKSRERAKWMITEGDIDEWQRAYPAVDIRQECYKAHSWIKANWDRRKTYSGYAKFLIKWFVKEQDNFRPGLFSKQRAAPGPGQNYDPTAGANDPTFGVF